MWDLEQKQVELKEVELKRKTHHASSLSQWLYQAIAEPGVRLRIRLRGNNLHVLCEASRTPEVGKLLPRLVQALKSQGVEFKRFFRNTEDPIYKVILYGRPVGQQRPAWIEPIILERLQLKIEPHDPHDPSPIIDATGETPEPLTGGALLISNETLARTGSPEAIARYLSESLAHLGVSVKVLIQKLPHSPLSESPEEEGAKRLWVICSCHYSPDASLIAEPIAQQLRDLELVGFKEAIIRSQVQGESTPDWVLPVDLTRPEEMLREWARWGDLKSIEHLVNQALEAQGIHVRAILKETTLHIFSCFTSLVGRSENCPPQSSTVEQIERLLKGFRPQGITAATLYGFTRPDLGIFQDEASSLDLGRLRDTPVWVQWLHLPAAYDPDLAPSTVALARQRHLDALGFLLQRLLNPDLEGRLATGGIRVKLCFKQDLLHIMTEAVVCPRQGFVVHPVEKFLRKVQITGLVGARIYGRRAGQTAPLWSYALDFQDRSIQHSSTLSGESPPQFSPSTVTVPTQDLSHEASLSHPFGLSTPASDSAVKQTLRDTCSLLKSVLCATKLAVGDQNNLEGWRQGSERDNRGIYEGIIWAMVGLLLMFQVDWLAGRWFFQQRPLAGLCVERPCPVEGDFVSESRPGEQSAVQEAILAAARSSNASFNNRLLDEKLALYQQRVRQSGVPDVLIVGSSRALRGVDPAVLRQALAQEGPADLDIFNFGINGATAQVVDLMLRRILAPEELPKLIIWADGARAFNSGRPDITYNAIASSEGYRTLSARPMGGSSRTHSRAVPRIQLPNLNQAIARNYRNFNQWMSDGLGEFFTLYPHRDELRSVLQDQLTHPLPSVAELNIDPLDLETVAGQEPITPDGFLPLDLRFDPSTYYLSHPRVSGAYDSDYDSFGLYGPQDVALRSILTTLEKHQVKLVFVNLPLTNEYLDPIRSEYERQFYDHMTRLSQQYNLIFLDLAQHWGSEYDYFSDPSHLNRYGAYQVSRYLAHNTPIPWQTGVEN
ncbi:DUF1574 family protein [Spirulina subsalsa FACHB-351]|uniref:DUF1574 family protein n=1 Tax=Spirulina subsalsa FACHB-351 TaxID=234711 RepID=A0ABT3LAF8_9CYAN|nr:DUF1574 family protein [Spirulina subsalsa]MCW6038489.1 DUF1574 family protein [Spirulina subsalsa FACHB-351]